MAKARNKLLADEQKQRVEEPTHRFIEFVRNQRFGLLLVAVAVLLWRLTQVPRGWWFPAGWWRLW